MYPYPPMFGRSNNKEVLEKTMAAIEKNKAQA
jgi:hypothetical protein